MRRRSALPSAPRIRATGAGRSSVHAYIAGGSTAQSRQVPIARDEKFTNLISDRVVAGGKF